MQCSIFPKFKAKIKHLTHLTKRPPVMRNKAFASLLNFYWLGENLLEKHASGYFLP